MITAVKTPLRDHEMKEEQATLLLIKGVVSELTVDEQAEVNRVAARFREILKEEGDAGVVAIALVGAEVAASQ